MYRLALAVSSLALAVAVVALLVALAGCMTVNIAYPGAAIEHGNLESRTGIGSKTEQTGAPTKPAAIAAPATVGGPEATAAPTP